MKNVRTSILAGVAVSAVMPLPGYAQGTGAATGGLEEIMVTARRRVEALQTTPVAVTAFSAAALERANVGQITDAGKLVPNLALVPTPTYLGASAAFIRGIGAQDSSMLLDTPVATYIDGVLLPRNIGGDPQITEPERVEILRGPQGTLFGRNTTGGAINITTKKPQKDFGFEQKLGYGSFNEWMSRTSVDTGELANSGLSARLVYGHRQRDGYVDNPFASDSNDPGSINSDAIVVKLHGDWDNLRMDYGFDWNDMRGYPAPFQITNATANVQSYLTNQTTGNRQVISTAYQDTLGFPLRPHRQINLGHSFTLELDLSDQLMVKSITGYRRFASTVNAAYSTPGLFGPVGTPPLVQEIFLYDAPGRKQTAHSFSEELQLLGTYEDFNFLAGLYYFDETGFDSVTARTLFVSSPTAARVTTSTTTFTAKAKSYAAFSQVSYKPEALDRKLELTAGIRYTKDKKRAEQVAAVARTANRTFNNVSYVVSAAYSWTDDVLTYVKYSTGYRSGGFNARATGTQRFDFPSEKVKAVEAGIKSEFFDHRLRFNGAVYYTDYDNLQTTIYTNTAAGQATGFTAPAAAKIKGFEAELNFIPFENFTIDAAVGYTNAEYDTIFFPNPVGGAITNYASISKFPYVPMWTTHVGAQYVVPDTGIGEFTARVDWSTMSRRWFHQNNLATLNPFNDQISSAPHYTIDARLILSDIPTGWSRGNVEVSVYVENLTDRHFRVTSIDFGALGFAGSVYNMPRRFGADVKFKY